ncbi:MAG: class I SAM-dependent methyltransferase [Magnetococcales bacterium]|nr:class I SAM-dependent methyltransferase [Magnetococcales bacterium]
MHHQPKHLFDPKKRFRLLDPEHRMVRDPLTLIHEMGIGEGMRVVDMGCGPGFFTAPLLKAVGSKGHIAAIDTQTEMLDTLKDHVVKSLGGMPDTLTIEQCDMRENSLETGSWDRVLLAFTLHEVDVPGALEEVRRLLHPEGELIALEWGAPPDPNAPVKTGPPMDHRLLPETLITLLEEAGFLVMGQEERIACCQYWIAAAPTPMG